MVFLYDEFQELRDRRSQGAFPLAALVSAFAAAQQDGLPVMLVACGLPPLIENLAAAQSYTERMFEGQRVGALGAPEDRLALVRPVERSSGATTTLSSSECWSSPAAIPTSSSTTDESCGTARRTT